MDNPPPNEDKQPKQDNQTAPEENPSHKKRNRENSEVSIDGNWINANLAIFGKTEAAAIIEKAEPITNFIQDYEPLLTVKVPVRSIEADITALTDHRLLILDSVDNNLMLGALTGIISHDTFGQTSKKRFNFDRNKEAQGQYRFRSLLDDYISEKKDILLILFTNATKSCEDFLSQVLSTDFTSGQGEYRKILLKANSYIIIAVSEPKYIEELTKQEKQCFLPRTTIPFLYHRLKEHFDEETVLLLNEAISQQRSRWAASEFDFYNQICRALQKGAEAFQTMVTDTRSNVREFEERDRMEIRAIVEADDKLMWCICFVAINFEGLTLAEFKYVVEALLSDKNKTEFVPNPLKQAERIERPLLVRWSDIGDRLLAKIHLREADAGQDGKMVISEKQGFHETFKQEFTRGSSMFFQQQFDYLFYNRQLIFDPYIPSRVLENFVRLAAKVAGNDPDMYCKQLLALTTLSIYRQQLQFSFAINPGDDLDRLLEIHRDEINEKIAGLHGKKLEEYRIVGLLVAEMYALVNLRQRIHDFFHFLLANKYHHAVLVLVKYCKNVPDFDTLHWLKQLLGRDINKVVKKDTFEFLSRHLFQTELEAYNGLIRVKQWYTGKPGAEADASIAGICIIIDYLSMAVGNVGIDDFGKEPIKLQPFHSIPGTEAAERITFFVEWLLHPDLPAACNILKDMIEEEEEEDDIDFTDNVLVPMLTWMVAIFKGVLNGGGIGAEPNAVSRQGDILIQTLVSKADRKQRQKILASLKDWKSFYAAQMAKQGKDQKRNRDIYRSLINISALITQQFNKISNPISI